MDDTERTQLLKDIVNKMRTDALIHDAKATQSKETWPQFFASFFAHPAVLLLIGFAVTGIIGGLLANRWQRREWDRQQWLQGQEWERQQLRLLDIHGIDLKYEIINEITKAVGERNAAARGILVPLLGGFSDTQLLKEEAEAIKNWQKVSNDWRANAQILKLKITAHIKSKEAPEIFKQLVAKETKIGAQVSSVRNDLRHYNRVDTNEEVSQDLDALINEIDSTGEDLKKLVTVIAEETQNDIRKKP